MQKSNESFSERFFVEMSRILLLVDQSEVNNVVDCLVRARDDGGRLFIAGSGGGAGHASHAAADFRNLAGFEAYSVSENTSEITALINDISWADSYAASLRNSRVKASDCLLVFSVGGGSEERNVSTNLIGAIREAKAVGSLVVGIVGRDGGFLREVADASVLVPEGPTDLVTAQVEAFQAVIWHMLVVHPRLSRNTPRWESLAVENHADS